MDPITALRNQRVAFNIKAEELWEEMYDSGLTRLSFERWLPLQRCATEADLVAEWEEQTKAGKTTEEYAKWRENYLWRNGDV